MKIPFDETDEKVKLADNVVIDFATHRKIFEIQKCKHTRALIDDANRELKCENCGIDIDPFDRLLVLVMEEQQINQELEVQEAIKRQAKEGIKRKSQKRRSCSCCDKTIDYLEFYYVYKRFKVCIECAEPKALEAIKEEK